MPFLLFSCAPKYGVSPEAQYVLASWYGPEFHGRPTASGETFDMNGKTAAHRTLPFGTILRVIYPETGRTAVVIVNDRGPFVKGREIDLSYGAAKDIGLITEGTGMVRLERLGRDESYVKEVRYSAHTGPFAVQTGSFSEPSNAERLREALSIKYSPVYVREAEVGGKKMYRVRVGKFQSREEAEKKALMLAEEGYSPLITGY